MVLKVSRAILGAISWLGSVVALGLLVALVGLVILAEAGIWSPGPPPVPTVYIDPRSGK